MRIALQFLLAMVLTINAVAINAAGAVGSCSPIPGADQVWSKASLHWVFIGEVHGSNETPAAFRELVCDAIAQGKHVTVALERPASEQTALDNIPDSQGPFSGQGSAAPTTRLERGPGWSSERSDAAAAGLFARASQAPSRLKGCCIRCALRRTTRPWSTR